MRFAPGPDGIPYAAWKRFGPLAVDYLWGALKVLESAGGLQALAAASRIESASFGPIPATVRRSAFEAANTPAGDP